MMTIKMQTVDKDIASKHLRFFRNRYERAIGRRDRDYVFIPILETQPDNFHFHILTDRPSGMSHEKYSDCFNKTIAKVKQIKRDYNKITAAYDLQGAVEYMTKFKNVDDDLDSINLRR